MLKRIVAKTKQVLILLLLTMAILAVMAVPAWAASLPFVGPINSLLTDALGWITGIIGTGGSLMFAYHAVMRNFIPDPQSVAHHTESMRKVAIGTALGAGASGLGTWISNTFSGGTSTTGMLFTHHAAMVAMIAGKFVGV